MAIGDILKDIGSGLETGAKAVGAVAQPILQRTAEVVSGEAPQIDQEQRTRQEQMEDAQLNAQAQELENQLEMGRKYGTLTPDQQQAYIDKITGLYNKPRHAPLLMERLRKAIHPNGAVAPTPTAPLKDATPTGGTAAADARLAAEKQHPRPVPGVHPFKGPDGKYYQPMYDGSGNVVNSEVEGYTPPPLGGVSKSPPLTGDKLPQDAVGPNGDPLPPEDRTVGKSFVEYRGQWWPVAKPKPILRTLQGHLVMIDPGTHNVIKDYGPQSGAKVTHRQTLQAEDDGQMHIVTLTSVTTPEGAQIDVQPEETGETEGTPSGGGGSAAPPSSAPKTPAKKVGSILPKTGAKPAGAGPVVPGLSTLAQNKLRNQAQAKADKDVVDAQKLSTLADLVAANPNDAINQKRLAVALERASAGRFTTQALDYVIKAGWGNTLEQWANNTTTGALPPDVLRQLVDGAHQNFIAAQKAQDMAYGRNTPPPAPQSSGQRVRKFNPATGRLE